MTSQFLDTSHPGQASHASERPERVTSKVTIDDALRTIRYELDIPGDARRKHIIQRLRSWLDVSPDEARDAVNAFAAARRRLDASELEWLDESEESAVMDGLCYREFLRLSGLVPWLRYRARQTMPPSKSPARLPSLAAALTWAGKGGKGAA
nr:hypothetical protein [uncultured bacterium]